MHLFENQNRHVYCVCNGKLPNSHSLVFDQNFNEIPKHMVLINFSCHAKFNALVCSSLFLENKSTYFELFSHPLSFSYKTERLLLNFLTLRPRRSLNNHTGEQF